jgi:hypothetical protein
VTVSGARELDRHELVRAGRALLARPWTARIALLIGLLAAGIFLLADGHDQTFWYDDWAFVLGRRGSDAGTFLEPHNGHLSLLPILAYKFLLAVGGMDTYWPFRLTVVVLHLVCATLIYVYAERRVGGWLALAASVPILFLGPAWQVIVWPFEMAWVASLGAGLGALLMLDRRDRQGNVFAAVLLTLSILSSGLGIAVLIGAMAETLLRRPRRPWVIAPPLSIYLVWFLFYSESNFALSRLAQVPIFTADAFASSVAALVGLAGRTVPDRGASLDWGRPLAMVAVGLIAWRLVRLGRVPPRVATLGATIVGFWMLTAVSRAGVTVGGYSLAPPYSSRYLYVGGFFLVLIAVELLRGVRLQPVAWGLLALAVTAGAFSHVGAFRDAGRYLRGHAETITTNLGAIDLAGDVVPLTYSAGPYVEAGPYREAARDWGTPALSPEELATGSPKVRAGADFVLTSLYGLSAPPQQGERGSGPLPTVEASASGDLTRSGSCVTLEPSGFGRPWVVPELDLLVPPGGVSVSAPRGQRVDVFVRRFGDNFPKVPYGVVQGGGTTVFRFPQDAAPQPWHLQLHPAGSVTACGIA